MRRPIAVATASSLRRAAISSSSPRAPAWTRSSCSRAAVQARFELGWRCARRGSSASSPEIPSMTSARLASSSSLTLATCAGTLLLEALALALDRALRQLLPAAARAPLEPPTSFWSSSFNASERSAAEAAAWASTCSAAQLRDRLLELRADLDLGALDDLRLRPRAAPSCRRRSTSRNASSTRDSRSARAEAMSPAIRWLLPARCSAATAAARSSAIAGTR